MSDTEIPTFEGRTVAEAIAKAAEHYSVPKEAIAWKLDHSHFRTPDGRMRSMDTVRIFAKMQELPDGEGVDAAVDWLVKLLGLMQLEGAVTGRVIGENSGEVHIDSPAARHLVGRRGATLRSIRHLMEAGLAANFGDWNIELNIEGGRRREERDDRGRGRDDRGRDDRGRDDRGRGRGRDRDDRGRDDRGRDDRGRDDRGRDDRRSDRDVDRLKKLARRLASKAVKTGETITMRKELNSFERRVVHLELAEFEGVETESSGDGSMKKIIIVPMGEE